MILDYHLSRTVRQGDVERLIQLFETHSPEFFLGQENKSNSNMLHILCEGGKQACIEEALRRLPVQVVRRLICQTDSSGNNPIHHAARYGFPDIAKLLVDAFRSSDYNDVDPSCPPWRAKNNEGELPVQVAVHRAHDDTAVMFLISIDPDFLRCDDDVGSLLGDAALFGCRRTLKAILTSAVGYSIKGFNPRRIVDLVENNDEHEALLFLKQHQELVKCLDYSDRMDVLCRATKKNFVDVVKTILSSIDASVSSSSTHLGRPSPLHTAANFDRLEIAKILVEEFNKSFKRQVRREKEAATRSDSKRIAFVMEEAEDVAPAASLLSFQPPWRLTNENGDTPLHDAVFLGYRELAASMLLWDLAFFSDLADVYEHPPIIPVVILVEQKGFSLSNSDELYLRHSLMALHLETLLQFLRQNHENVATKLIKQHPELVRFKDASGRTILQYALDENDVRVMSLVLKIDPSAIHTQDREQEEHLLIKACCVGNLPAIGAICAICPHCPQDAVRRADQTTALHNIRLQNLEEYRALLRIPEIARLVYKIDALGRSPLIKAIQEDNVYLAQAIFEIGGIDVMDTKSREGKTAAVMIKDKSKGSTEWANLYKKVKQATSYIPVGTDLKEMRSTLSVVAALLATITFAAAFTVPGGFDQNSGDVLLGRRASFLVFLLSDTYAMCCSMIVLCSLIWSMVGDSDKALLLIDRSVFVLQQSLYATLVAFMAGVYTMVSHKSLWAAVVVCIMCSCVPISANRTVLVKMLDKFVPTSTSVVSSRELKEVSVQQR